MTSHVPPPPPQRSLNRTSPLPLWAQLSDAIERRIRAGEFAEQLPTEQRLRSEYGISRQTVRQALGHLRAAGLLTAQRGRGTFLLDEARTAHFVQPLGALYSLFRAIEAGGIEQRSEVRSLATVRDAVASAALGISPGAPLVYLERLRLAGGAPLAVDRAWLPLDLAAPLLDADFSHTALYDELARRCGIRLTDGSEEIRALIPDARQRRLLGLPPGIAVLEIERRAKAAGRMVEFRRTLVRGDRFSVAAQWSAETAFSLEAVSRSVPGDAA